MSLRDKRTPDGAHGQSMWIRNGSFILPGGGETDVKRGQGFLGASSINTLDADGGIMITDNELKLSYLVLGCIQGLVGMMVFALAMGFYSESLAAIVSGLCFSLVTVVTRKIFGNGDNGDKDDEERVPVRPRKKVVHDE